MILQFKIEFTLIKYQINGIQLINNINEICVYSMHIITPYTLRLHFLIEIPCDFIEHMTFIELFTC